jgi:hypothetical protein
VHWGEVSTQVLRQTTAVVAQECTDLPRHPAYTLMMNANTTNCVKWSNPANLPVTRHPACILCTGPHVYCPIDA